MSSLAPVGLRRGARRRSIDAVRVVRQLSQSQPNAPTDGTSRRLRTEAQRLLARKFPATIAVVCPCHRRRVRSRSERTAAAPVTLTLTLMGTGQPPLIGAASDRGRHRRTARPSAPACAATARKGAHGAAWFVPGGTCRSAGLRPRPRMRCRATCRSGGLPAGTRENRVLMQSKVAGSRSPCAGANRIMALRLPRE